MFPKSLLSTFCISAALISTAPAYAATPPATTQPPADEFTAYEDAQVLPFAEAIGQWKASAEICGQTKFEYPEQVKTVEYLLSARASQTGIGPEKAIALEQHAYSAVRQNGQQRLECSSLNFISERMIESAAHQGAAYIHTATGKNEIVTVYPHGYDESVDDTILSAAAVRGRDLANFEYCKNPSYQYADAMAIAQYVYLARYIQMNFSLTERNSEEQGAFQEATKNYVNSSPECGYIYRTVSATFSSALHQSVLVIKDIKSK